MSDEEETKASLERWKARLEAGEPIMQFDIDERLIVRITPEGAVLLKFVWGQLGNFETAAMGLAVLSPAVASRLKATFANAENIPDTPPPMREPRSKN
jgi:hypothetical protein